MLKKDSPTIPVAALNVAQQRSHSIMLLTAEIEEQQGKCFLLYVLAAARELQFPSNPLVISRYTAKTVINPVEETADNKYIITDVFQQNLPASSRFGKVFLFKVSHIHMVQQFGIYHIHI